MENYAIKMLVLAITDIDKLKGLHLATAKSFDSKRDKLKHVTYAREEIQKQIDLVDEFINALEYQIELEE